MSAFVHRTIILIIIFILNGTTATTNVFVNVSANNPPTTVTCGVCGAVRFYRFVKQARKFGIYSCESCRKFISKMLKKEKVSQRSGPVVMQCLKGEGEYINSYIYINLL